MSSVTKPIAQSMGLWMTQVVEGDDAVRSDASMIALRRYVFAVLVVLTPLTVPGRVAAQGTHNVSPVVESDPVLERIVKPDRAVPEQFTAVFEMRRPAYPVPQPAALTSRCVLTSGDRFSVLVIESELSGDPVFRAPSTPGYQRVDFDESGNLILWRSLEKRAISTPELNRVYDIQEKSLVAPNGRILEKTAHRQVYVYPVGSPSSLYEVVQLQMATGRGYSRHLSAFESQRTSERGLWEVVGSGTFGSALTGRWSLEMDLNEESLVRIATFRPEGGQDPAIRVVTEGTIRVGQGLKLASSGTLEFGRMSGDSRVEVRLIEYRPLPPEPAIVRDLREQLSGPIPNGTEVIDYSGYEPRRYVVGED